MVSSIIFAFFSSLALGAPPPPDFLMPQTQKQARFVDMLRARHVLDFDAKKRKLSVVSTLHFRSPQRGYPLFDFVPALQRAWLNGTEVAIGKSKSPDGFAQMRFVDSEVDSGDHVLEIEFELKAGVNIAFGKVSAGFWLHDLEERQFLEQYLPTNFEFDVFPMTYEVRVHGTTHVHEVFTNGQIVQQGENFWTIEYPEYFTASSSYFHLTAKDRFQVRSGSFRSISGRDVPVRIYLGKGLSGIDAFWDRTFATLRELESDFGPYPHPEVLVYGSTERMGGMEYSGATITDLPALAHELTHFYFARGVMPGNGNAGWIDEAIASWRDRGYPSAELRTVYSHNLAAVSPYRRGTTREAYTHGASVLSAFDWMSGARFKFFLRDWFAQRAFGAPYTTPEFLGEVERFLGRNLGEFNDFHVYGRGKPSYRQSRSDHPFHLPVSRSLHARLR